MRKIVNIKRIVAETDNTKSFFFDMDDEGKALPGQFYMVWLPSVDEIPMSISKIGKEMGITVRKAGDATTKMHELKVGARLGLRGPYGNGFRIQGNRLLVVGGGTGIAPMLPVVERARLKDREVTVVAGAKSASELLFQTRLTRLVLKERMHVCTDDGSAGFCGTAADRAEELIKECNFDQVLTCGPEIMMKRVVYAAEKKNIPSLASLERYMKCGLGLCDSCAIDGLHVCKDGPVFEGKTLLKMREFGKFRRDACGVRERLGTCANAFE